VYNIMEQEMKLGILRSAVPRRLRVMWTADQPEWPEDGFAPDPAVNGVYAMSENNIMEREMKLGVMSHRLGVMEVMSHRLKKASLFMKLKGSLFMKLARKQFDYRFRLPEPRSMGGPHEISIPPWAADDDPWGPRGPRSAGSHATTIPPWVPRRGYRQPRMMITNHEPWSPRSDDDFTDHEAEYNPDEEDDDV
jgi:hypothetical protein